MTFAAAYSQERNEKWADVWPAVKNTVWHGDNVLVHCIKGRHHGAFLGILCRALLEGESRPRHEEVAAQDLSGHSRGDTAS